jgi:hypothetical protein
MVTSPAPTLTRFTVTDMVTGLFAVLSRGPYRSFYTKGPRFEHALFAAYVQLTSRAVEFALDVRFSVPTPDSPRVFPAALSSLVSRGLAFYHDWDFEMNTREFSVIDLEKLPGGSGLYRDLASTFLADYNKRPEALS